MMTAFTVLLMRNKLSCLKLVECPFISVSISMHDEKSALKVLTNLHRSPASLLTSTLMHKCFLDVA